MKHHSAVGSVTTLAGGSGSVSVLGAASSSVDATTSSVSTTATSADTDGTEAEAAGVRASQRRLHHPTWGDPD